MLLQCASCRQRAQRVAGRGAAAQTSQAWEATLAPCSVTGGGPAACRLLAWPTVTSAPERFQPYLPYPLYIAVFLEEALPQALREAAQVGPRACCACCACVPAVPVC